MPKPDHIATRETDRRDFVSWQRSREFGHDGGLDAGRGFTPETLVGSSGWLAGRMMFTQDMLL